MAEKLLSDEKKEKARIRRKNWRENNKEHIKEYEKKYREEHKEELRKLNSKYTAKRKAERQLKRKQYLEEHKDEIEKEKIEKFALRKKRKREATRKSYLKHKTKYQKSNKKWQEANAEKVKSYKKQCYERNKDKYLKSSKQKVEELKKLFYGKNPYRMFCYYINCQYYNYISSFKNYLFISKSEKFRSYMLRLAKGTITEDECILEIEKVERIQWQEKDEEIYLKVIKECNPAGKLPMEKSIFKHNFDSIKFENK